MVDEATANTGCCGCLPCFRRTAEAETSIIAMDLDASMLDA